MAWKCSEWLKWMKWLKNSTLKGGKFGIFKKKSGFCPKRDFGEPISEIPDNGVLICIDT